MERTGLCIFAVPVTSCLSGTAVTGDAPAVAATSTMTFPGKHWQQARPESQGVDPGKLEAAVSYLKKNSGPDGVKELVIIPEWNMVVVRLGLDQRDFQITSSIYSTFLEKVGESIRKSVAPEKNQ